MRADGDESMGPDDEDERPRRRRRRHYEDERPERPFGGDVLFFITVALTLFIPVIGIVGGLVDMGGRTQARRTRGLGLLLLSLVVFVVYAIYLAR